VDEHPPTVAEDAVGVEEEAEGDGAVVDVAVGLYLHPAEHAVVRAQLLFAAVRLDEAMGTVGGVQVVEGLGLGDQGWLPGRFGGQDETDRHEQEQQEQGQQATSHRKTPQKALSPRTVGKADVTLTLQATESGS